MLLPDPQAVAAPLATLLPSQAAWKPQAAQHASCQRCLADLLELGLAAAATPCEVAAVAAACAVLLSSEVCPESQPRHGLLAALQQGRHPCHAPYQIHEQVEAGTGRGRVARLPSGCAQAARRHSAGPCRLAGQPIVQELRHGQSTWGRHKQRKACACPVAYVPNAERCASHLGGCGSWKSASLSGCGRP